MHTIGARLKAWRALKKLKQPEAASVFGVKPSSYQKYEMDLSAPGAEAIECFVRAGINANWLLTGEGPMLLDDLQRPIIKRVLAGINIEALEAIIEGALKINPNGSPQLIAEHSASLYKTCIDQGMITPEGIGEGNMDDAV